MDKAALAVSSALSEPDLNHDHELPSYVAHTPSGRGSAISGSSSSNNGLASIGREHHRYLETPKGKKWLSMYVKSRSTSVTSLPVFFEGDTISGRVELDLDKADSGKSVTISVSFFFAFLFQLSFRCRIFFLL